MNTENVPRKKAKGEIKKFNVSLTEEQKLVKARILNNNITLLKGKAGSSKSFLACNVALDLLFRSDNTIERIFVARPFIYAENEMPLGALPGGVQEKLIGITTPIIENMYILAGKEKIDALLLDGTISILPVAFMRGMTIANAIFILDEFQNATLSATYTALSRIGKGSKTIITGDMTQCDLKNKKESGFDFFKKLETEKLPGFEIITLVGNHRHDVVDLITTIYLDYKD